MHTEKNAKTKDEGSTYLRTGNFINTPKARRAMENAGNVPLLCVDSSSESKKAKQKLEGSRKHFAVRQVRKQTEKIDLKPPVLFASEGVFRGYDEIEAYAISVLGS